MTARIHLNAASGEGFHYRKWLIAAAAAFVMLGGYVAALTLSEKLLVVRHNPVKADMIVVLGGDGPPRAARAAELWHAGLAPDVVVAGNGDCTSIRDMMVRAGVPRDVINIDCLSRNTRENALNSIPFVEVVGAASAILVTSSFHSRRAWETFHAICPGTKWISLPAEDAPGSLAFSAQYGPSIAYEYIKLVAYRLRRAVLPPSNPPPGASCADETIRN